MKIILIAGLSCLLGLAEKCAADSYIWEGGPTGDFSSMTGWFDVTMPDAGGGPPGGGDSADATGADMTFESGSVMELQGESATFDVEGSFSTGSLQGNETIVGGSTLNADTVVATLDIEGGHVSANSFASSETSVDSAGSLTVSGTLKDHRYLECSGTGSTISAPGGMNDVGMIINAGGQVTAGSIMNLLGSSSTIQGSGAMVSVTGDFDLAEGATLEMYSGGTLQVNGKLDLDGGTNISDGGATWSDPGTTVQVSGQLTVGTSKGSFYMTVENGAQFTSGASYIGGAGSKLGYVTMSDSNTLWTVATSGLSVGTASAGDLMINNGATLDLYQNTGLVVGLLSGSAGTLVLDGAGSYIGASSAYTSIGADSGSQGTIQIQNQAAMVAGADFYVGDNGTGSLNLSSGQLTVIGSGTSFDIGHVAGANGNVSISEGSALTVQGPTTVGDAGVGSLLLGGSTVRTDGTTVGNTSSSTGTAYITGANSYWIDTSRFTVGLGAGSTGTVYVRVQGSLQLTGNCSVGAEGNGSLYLQSGGTCYIGGADTINHLVGIGGEQGSSGVVSVSDTNSFLSANGLFLVGGSGNGSVVVSNGAGMRTSVLELAQAPGSTGRIDITGAGSTWVSGGSVAVGGSANQPGGAGNVLVQNSGTARFYPLLYVSPTGVVTLDSTGQIAVGTGAFGAPGTLRVSTGGKLYGKGRIQGQVIVGAGGVFLPGDSPGIFTIDGNFQQEEGGETDIFIGGSTPGSGYSQISISGTASIGGTLNVILTNGYTPSPGQTFDFLSAAAMSGAFSHINGASISYGSTGATLSNVTGATGTPQLSIQNEGQSVVVTWPETVQGYSLQTSSTLESNSWSTVTAEENTYVAPAASGPAFFRLIQ